MEYSETFLFEGIKLTGKGEMQIVSLKQCRDARRCVSFTPRVSITPVYNVFP